MTLHRIHQACAGRLVASVFIMHTAVSPTAAQPYPSQTIRIVVGAAAGTPPDIVTRIVANQLSESEGWRIVVENKPGAMTTLAASEVLRQSGDGYSILPITLSSTVGATLLPNAGVQFQVDFVPVIKLATAYHVLVVNPTLPVKSMTELITLLKQHPDKLTFSSAGFGTPAHMAGELFKLQTGVRATHVPYQSLARAIADLISGTNQYQFITPLPVLDLIATGKLRALVVTSPERMPALREVSTVVEAGFPQLIIQDWNGFVVKRGTPETVVNRLNLAINKVLETPKARDAIAKLSAEAAGGSPGEFGSHLAAQIEHWTKVVNESGMKMHQ